MIAQKTDHEFRATLRHYARQIDRLVSSKEIYPIHLLSKSHDFHSTYHKWRAGRVNCHIDLFIKHLEAEYANFIQENEIAVDYELVPRTDAQRSSIERMAAEILAFKSKELKDTSIERTRHDAELIYLISDI